MKTFVYAISTIFAFCLLLQGCAQDYWRWKPYERMPNKGTYGGAVTGVAVGGAIAGASGVGAVLPAAVIMGSLAGGALYEAFQERKPLLEKLARYGVQLIIVGDEVKFVLPSDNFFYYESPNPSPIFYKAMELIIVLLRCMDKISIKVAAYTDICGSPIRDKALTTQQAQYVANYLWSQCIDARLIYGVGYGQACPIANNVTYKGHSQNRRIEITFRRLNHE